MLVGCLDSSRSLPQQDVSRGGNDGQWGNSADNFALTPKHPCVIINANIKQICHGDTEDTEKKLSKQFLEFSVVVFLCVLGGFARDSRSQ